MKPGTPFAERFWSKVERRGPAERHIPRVYESTGAADPNLAPPMTLQQLEAEAERRRGRN